MEDRRPGERELGEDVGDVLLDGTLRHQEVAGDPAVGSTACHQREHLVLTLREVAEVINMHESTVSRVTNEKYVQTPRGVLPLKFFFSSGLSTTGGEDVSARGIKAQIEKLVSDEDPKHPLTDQAIVNILKESGVQIARRTVAKYRDQLGVLSARMRKRV